MYPMPVAVHQVVGLIEVPSDGPWSADALVKQCLGIRSQPWEREGFVIAGRLPVRPPFESARLFADVPTLQTELQELFEEFLDG